MKAITTHEINGTATKIETKEGLAKTTTTNVVIKARIGVIAMATMAIGEITNQPRNKYNNGYQQNYHNNNRPREPQLSNMSSFIT